MSRIVVEPAPWSVVGLADSLTRGQWRAVREHFGDRGREALERLERQPCIANVRAMAEHMVPADMAALRRLLTCEQWRQLYQILYSILPEPPDGPNGS